jgi:hypothetical protein
VRCRAPLSHAATPTRTVAGAARVCLLLLDSRSPACRHGGDRFQEHPDEATPVPFCGAIAFILMAATLILTLAAHWIVQQRYRHNAH